MKPNISNGAIQKGYAFIGAAMLALGLTVTGLQADGPPAPPPITYQVLNFWFFRATNNFATVRGDAPLSATNLMATTNAWGRGAVHVMTNKALLKYRETATNATRAWTNLLVDEGCLRFWFRNHWQSSSLGGTGPGTYARLIEVGDSSSTNGYWTLYFHPAGTNLYFASTTNSALGGVYLSAPIQWASNYWHLIALNYSRSNCQLFIDGQMACTNTGLAYWPGPNVRTNGFTLGGDCRATNLVKGDISDLVTGRGYFSPESVTNTFENMASYYPLGPDGGGDQSLVWQSSEDTEIVSSVAENGAQNDDSVTSASRDNGGISLNLETQAPYLEMIYNPPGSFYLDMYDLEPGVIYGIAAKDTLSSDPYNTWALLNVFEAQASAMESEGTVSSAQRMYTVANLMEYSGPKVTIVSPLPESTVSGDHPLQVAVSDILGLVRIEVYVGDTQVGVINAGQNGFANIPTYLFPNGEQDIWVHVLNEGVEVDTDGDNEIDDVQRFDSWESVTVNFLNDAYVIDYSPQISQAGSVTLEYATTTQQDYTFEVFRLNGDLLHSEDGQSVNDNITAQWDFTDLLGQPVSDSAYVFSLTFDQEETGVQPASMFPGSKIVMTISVDHGVTVGKYLIGYGEWPSSSINEGLAGVNDYVSARVNGAAIYDSEVIGVNREAYGTLHVDFSSDPYPIRRNTQVGDLTALTNALKDTVTGSWLFDSHAGTDDMIPGRDGWLTVRLTAKEIGHYLGTTFEAGGSSANYGKRLFSTMLTGCGAAGGDFPIATGTPPGLKQIGNSRVKKSVFLAFMNVSYENSTKWGWIDRIHYEWLNGNDYDMPFGFAVNNANAAYPTVWNWGPTIYGYSLLEYNADASR